MDNTLKDILGIGFGIVSLSVFGYVINDAVSHTIRKDYVEMRVDTNNNGFLEPNEKKELFKICGEKDKPLYLPITRENYEIAEKYYENKK